MWMLCVCGGVWGCGWAMKMRRCINYRHTHPIPTQNGTTSVTFRQKRWGLKIIIAAFYVFFVRQLRAGFFYYPLPISGKLCLNGTKLGPTTAVSKPIDQLLQWHGNGIGNGEGWAPGRTRRWAIYKQIFGSCLTKRHKIRFLFSFPLVLPAVVCQLVVFVIFFCWYSCVAGFQLKGVVSGSLIGEGQAGRTSNGW